MLQRAGFRDVLVDWGGDVKVLGQHPERRGTWRAGVARPPSLEELFARFSAADGDGGVDTEVVSEIVTLEGGRCLAASGDFGAAPRKCGRRDIACTTRTRAGRLGAYGCRVGACGCRVSAYGCRFGHHHVVDPRTGQLLKCGREAPALAAVEAESCALADALATALLVAGSVAEARGWICEAAAAGQLPPQVTRVWLCCREDMQLLCFEPHAEARAAAAAAALRRALRAVPHPVPPPSCRTLRTQGCHPVHPGCHPVHPSCNPVHPGCNPCVICAVQVALLSCGATHVTLSSVVSCKYRQHSYRKYSLSSVVSCLMRPPCNPCNAGCNPTHPACNSMHRSAARCDRRLSASTCSAVAPPPPPCAPARPPPTLARPPCPVRPSRYPSCYPSRLCERRQSCCACTFAPGVVATCRRRATSQPSRAWA